MAAVAAIPTGTILDALSPMLNLIDDLEQAGTVKYDNGDGLIIYGTIENDYEIGTVYGDIMVTGDWDDQIFSLGGDDTIYGGDGFDTVD